MKQDSNPDLFHCRDDQCQVWLQLVQPNYGLGLCDKNKYFNISTTMQS